MKPKTLALVGIAVICGLAAAYLTAKLIGSTTEETSVLVAKNSYKKWALITKPEEMFELKPMLSSKVPDGAITEISQLEGCILIKSIDEGNPVDKTFLKFKPSLPLDPGRRAMTVTVTPASVVGGFVQPGSFVDIYHTIPARGTHDALTRLVLQNILVKAVDQNPVPAEDKEGKTAQVPTTVTFDVDPKQTKKLINARDSGGLITLALRPPGDKDSEEDPGDQPPPPVIEVEKGVSVLMVQNGSNWIRQYNRHEGDGTRTTTIKIERKDKDGIKEDYKEITQEKLQPSSGLAAVREVK